jgi:hypothetical protein
MMDAVTIIRIVAGLLVLVLIPVTLIPYWVIFKKAGFSAWLSLLMIIPVVNLIVLYVIAFSEWRGVPASNPMQQNFPPRA